MANICITYKNIHVKNFHYGKEINIRKKYIFKMIVATYAQHVENV